MKKTLLLKEELTKNMNLVFQAITPLRKRTKDVNLHNKCQRCVDFKALHNQTLSSHT